MADSGMVIGRLFGIEIRASRSWIFVLVFVTLTMVSQLERANPAWGQATSIAAGVVMAVLFFASVIAHELSHCLVARRFGIQARSISLNFFGGLSWLSRQAVRPGEELAFSVAGPAINLVLGVACVGLGFLLSGHAEVVAEVATRTGYVNLILAAFNLIPGAPLDGGRILRAIVWRATGSYERGTLASSIAGQAVGALVIMAGLAVTFAGDFTGLLIGLVGYYLLMRARASLGEVALRRALEGLTFRNLWLDTLPQIERSAKLTDFLRELAPSVTTDPHFMVVDNGVIWGLLPASRVLRIDARKWDELSVGDVMTPIDRLEKLSYQTEIMRAMEAVFASDTSELPVVDNNEIQGFVGRDALMRFVASRLAANG
jgi:Zn-dependent protease